jgi:ATP-dependent phosphofructokinase / diphosphate-dependent phosphofructokinase
MSDNLLIVHGGGPTAVINASLYGALMEAKKHSYLDHIYGAKYGTGGILKENLIELEHIPQSELDLLLTTPGSAIGTSRDSLGTTEYAEMAEILRKRNIKYVLFNGGNGTMDTCGKLYKTCHTQGMEINVIGIPKTMDNDIAETDHSPGFGSAARYIAASVKEVCADVRSLPIHVVVVEASGRDTGWITAASVLAGQNGGPGPDLIYLPERPFDEKTYLDDIERLLKKKTGIVVVASEGLKNAAGNPIVDPIFTVGRATYFGDVGTYLANLVIKKLGYKARGEKPGLLGRASVSMQSFADREEAVLAGETACKAVLQGDSGKMVAFRRISTIPYKIEPVLIDIDKVMLVEKKVPDEFINAAGNGITDAFIQWCRPLIGNGLPEMISFTE